MKKNEIEVGGVYSAKVSGNIVPVRIDSESPRGGWEATNLKTKKSVRIKSAQRLRGKAATWPGKKMPPEDAKAVHAAGQENARLAEQRAKSTDGQTPGERVMAQSAGAAARAKKAKTATQNAKPATKRDLPTGQAGTGERGAKGAKRISGLDAAAQVLAEASEPLNTKAMVERMLAQGLWRTKGATPASTIYAAIIREIAVKGDAARFRKVERGKFTLTG